MSLSELGSRQPRISVPDTDPDAPRYLVPSNERTGVVGFGQEGEIDCTGALYLTGRHIITAAHCFDRDDDTANLNPNPAEYTVFFDLPQGRVPVSVAQIFVHPEWTADAASNNDIAVIELAQIAPAAAERYDVYTDSDEVGKVFDRVGFGTKATGIGGEVDDDNPRKRQGQNRYDALGEIANTLPEDGRVLPGTQLAYDFDSGQPQNDAFGIEFGIPDLGLGIEEIGSSRGDSGGPAFIDGKIAGVSSYGSSPLTPGVDVTEPNDTSFGEFFFDTRVSAYLPFIGGAIATSNQGDNNFSGTEIGDLLFGNAGRDSISGADGDDSILGGRDADVLSGDAGNDFVAGNRGNDLVDGGEGNDSLFGGQENDTLTGGVGDDVLVGDFGQDILTGGDGADTFTLRRATAVTEATLADVVTDFEVGDRIALTQGLTESDLSLEPLDINGSGVAIRVAGETAFLGFVRNVTVADLTGRFTADTLGLS